MDRRGIMCDCVLAEFWRGVGEHGNAVEKQALTPLRHQGLGRSTHRTQRLVPRGFQPVFTHLKHVISRALPRQQNQTLTFVFWLVLGKKSPLSQPVRATLIPPQCFIGSLASCSGVRGSLSISSKLSRSLIKPAGHDGKQIAGLSGCTLHRQHRHSWLDDGRARQLVRATG